MNDLLGSARRVLSGRFTQGLNGDDRDLEAGPAIELTTGTDMAQFFVEVGVIQTDLAEINKSLRKLKDAHEESKIITNAKAMKGLKERMAKDIGDVGKVAKSIKGKIEALDQENINNRRKPNCGPNSSTDRARMNMTGSLKNKLKELMTEFQNLRQKFSDEYREVVERRVYTVTGQAVDEAVIDQLIETGDSEQIFQKAIQEQGRGQILDTIAEIHERHDAVKDIEKKLLELYQIFTDMAVLVEHQGEMLDNIEDQTNKAVEHVQQATTALVSARKYQKNTRKCICWSTIVLIIVIVVIVLIIVRPGK